MLQPSAAPLPLLWLLAAAGLLVLAIWLYLWLFHHRFWTTRIPPVGQPLPRSATAAGSGNRATGNNTAADASRSNLSQSATGLPFSAQTSTKASHSPSAPANTGQAVADCRPVDVTANTGQSTAVLVVIPARNEAEVIARTVADVLMQDYEGPLHLVVVNDNSHDDTATLAEHSARETLAALLPQRKALRHFSVISGRPLPAGWSGKLWALEQGIAHGLGDQTHTPANAVAPQHVWLTDADIAHRPQVLRELLARAHGDNRALVSRMALLCTDTAAERWTIPAFVYFFQMLYPFAAIAEPRSGIHGAAGGCILLECDYLRKIGGIAALRGALIDDCTLAAHVARAGGRLWLELTQSSISQRGYGGAQGVSDMIARTAYTQLRYSPLRLIGTVFGLVLTFLCPLLLPLFTIALLATPEAQTAATIESAALAANAAALLPTVLAIACPLAAVAILFGTFVPMLRFYSRSPLRALALPLIACFYLFATITSAVRYYRGKTGNWKGRVYQNG